MGYDAPTPEATCREPARLRLCAVWSVKETVKKLTVKTWPAVACGKGYGKRP